ncbi:pyridoxamine 5'-phosphate oxidase family protein [Streptomyces sp. NPDC050263]|uniref:pyridoxamine 5'-phosphate oxidase family protein n=1 Tax=Streptomyces sp. NPDC050263 TaxID=3155037 RepID=UPI0034338086
MSLPPAALHMVEVSGAEALWLVEGSSLGRLVYAQRGLTAVRPARHVGEYGRLIVRAPVQAAVVPEAVTYQVDEIRVAAGTGWTVTVSGSAEMITDPNEVAHYRRTLAGWSHGPHDTVLRIHPKSVIGFRLARAEA